MPCANYQRPANWRAREEDAPQQRLQTIAIANMKILSAGGLVTMHKANRVEKCH